MLPTVGRIVHFYPNSADVRGGDSEFYAAIVVKVHDAHGVELVDLVTFGTSSIYFHNGIEERGVATEGDACWAWPPRVEGGR